MVMGKKTALLLSGIILVAGGLLLSGWVTWAVFKPVPPRAPYSYALIKEGNVGSFPDLGLGEDDGKDHGDLVIRKYELRVEEIDKPVAVLHTGTREDESPVILDWHSNLAEPVVNIASRISQTTTVAKAVSKHAPEGASVIGWWDVSRRLKLLSQADVLFDRHLARPLLLPEVWRRHRETIEAEERKFWGMVQDQPQELLFERFVEALLSDEQAAAAAALRRLTGGREAFLVFSLQDAFKLGAMHPDRFGIGFKDFAKSGDTHGLASTIKKWLKEEGYDNYTMQQLHDTVVRVYFLTDERSSRTLLSQALPFSNSRPLELTEIELVYQHGDYWVYRVPPAAKAARLESDTPAL